MRIQQQADRPTVLGDKTCDGDGELGKQSGHVYEAKEAKNDERGRRDGSKNSSLKKGKE